MKKLRFIALAIVLVTLMAAGINGCVSAPVYQGPPSDHFDGSVFRNSVPSEKGVWDILRLGFYSLWQREAWPAWIEEPQQQIPVERFSGQGISVTFINHSTLLLQVDGVNILTDPVFSERVSPFRFAGPKRVRLSGVALKDLPPIDVILISHNHYDHLDTESLQKIVARQPSDQQPLILAGLGNSGLFELLGLPGFVDMDWQGALDYKGIQIIFTEARHRSGRGITDQMKTLWGSFLIRTKQGDIYFAGDTGYGPHFDDLRRQYGDVELALLPIGAYRPLWFMQAVHLTPAQAVEAHLAIGSQQSIGMHFGTFQLTHEGIDEPEAELAEALAAQGVPSDRFITLGFGETRQFIPAKRELSLQRQD